MATQGIQRSFVTEANGIKSLCLLGNPQKPSVCSGHPCLILWVLSLTACTCPFPQTTSFGPLESLCLRARRAWSSHPYPSSTDWGRSLNTELLSFKTTQTCVIYARSPLEIRLKYPLSWLHPLLCAALLTPFTNFSQNYFLRKSLTRERARVCFWGI